jgi:ring-1,2-phenylacetyl-CoA epoxidase subunit PaaD
VVTIDADAVDTLVREVEDPELPHVTIGDLGIVREVTVAGAVATVVLTPTYTGCPATDQIRDDVTAAVRAAGYEPVVRLVLSPAWTTDWITERGRQRLATAGIAPPAGGTTQVELPPACPRCGSLRSRLVTEFGSTACKAAYTCGACLEPFEAFKVLR